MKGDGEANAASRTCNDTVGIWGEGHPGKGAFLPPVTTVVRCPPLHTRSSTVSPNHSVGVGVGQQSAGPSLTRTKESIGRRGKCFGSQRQRSP